MNAPATLTSLLLFQFFVKVFKQCFFCLFGVGPLKAMSCTFKCQQIGFDRGSLQFVDQPNRLFMRDVLVFCPVNAERRSGVGAASGVTQYNGLP